MKIGDRVRARGRTGIWSSGRVEQVAFRWNAAGALIEHVVTVRLDLGCALVEVHVGATEAERIRIGCNLHPLREYKVGERVEVLGLSGQWIPGRVQGVHTSWEGAHQTHCLVTVNCMNHQTRTFDPVDPELRLASLPSEVDTVHAELANAERDALRRRRKLDAIEAEPSCSINYMRSLEVEVAALKKEHVEVMRQRDVAVAAFDGPHKFIDAIFEQLERFYTNGLTPREVERTSEGVRSVVNFVISNGLANRHALDGLRARLARAASVIGGGS